MGKSGYFENKREWPEATEYIKVAIKQLKPNSTHLKTEIEHLRPGVVLEPRSMPRMQPKRTESVRSGDGELPLARLNLGMGIYLFIILI